MKCLEKGWEGAESCQKTREKVAEDLRDVFKMKDRLGEGEEIGEKGRV